MGEGGGSPCARGAPLPSAGGAQRAAVDGADRGPRGPPPLPLGARVWVLGAAVPGRPPLREGRPLLERRPRRRRVDRLGEARHPPGARPRDGGAADLRPLRRGARGRSPRGPRHPPVRVLTARLRRPTPVSEEVAVRDTGLPLRPGGTQSGLAARARWFPLQVPLSPVTRLLDYKDAEHLRCEISGSLPALKTAEFPRSLFFLPFSPFVDHTHTHTKFPCSAV
mmetsp:Transcript_30624/g.72881  ORF Transcript_30624/g.72881 Transcript_30624/m.72881 type:complete len:223 (+) Transcript_30624:158-826(+)